MQEPNIVIHIGYPKTATTSLQMQLFYHHPEINYLGPNFDYPARKNWKQYVFDQNLPLKNDEIIPRWEQFREFWNNIRDLDQIRYQANKEHQSALYQEKIEPLLNTQQTNVFSCEGMLNNQYNDLALKGQRIQEFFKNAKILIILRNQIDVIISLYRMAPYSPLLGMGTLKKVLPIEKWIQINFQYFSYSFLYGVYYFEIISFYYNLFGKDRVGVFLFEDLKTEPTKFAEEISKFLDIDMAKTTELIQEAPKNTAKDHTIHNLRLKLIPGIQFSKFLPKRLHQSSIQIFSELVPNKKPKLTQETYEKLNELYKDSNRKLIDEFGIDVSKYNYPC